MNQMGFIRVCAAAPKVHVADPQQNSIEISTLCATLEKAGAGVAVFPELSLTGCSCQDLFLSSVLLDASEKAMESLLEQTSGLSLMFVVGAPVLYNGTLLDAAVVIQKGEILGIVPKTVSGVGSCPSAKLFHTPSCLLEEAPSAFTYAKKNTLLGTRQLFCLGGTLLGVEFLDDMLLPICPSNHQAASGAQVILSLSGSPESVCRHQAVESLLLGHSRHLLSSVVMAAPGYGESTKDASWGGDCLIVENGKVLSQGDRYQVGSTAAIADVDVDYLRYLRLKQSACFTSGSLAYTKVQASSPQDLSGRILRPLERHPFVPDDAQEISRRCREILDIQVQGIMTRMDHIGSRQAVIGISGGLDSTLALLVTVLAYDKMGLDRKGILAVTMPGFGTSSRTHGNAVELMEKLGVTTQEISIKMACLQHFEDICQDPDNHDVTYENAQARERTQILFDLANKTNGIVVGTGDLSELALGWCTYNGDHMASYGVNAGIPKTLVQAIVSWAARNRFSEKDATGRSIGDILLDIVDTPISPELTPTKQDGTIKQKTEDLVGPYELHDFFLYHFLATGCSAQKILLLSCQAFEGVYDPDTIQKWLSTFMRRFFSQQFKRSCLPDGPRVGSVSLSPRGDWSMPDDVSGKIWRL